MNREQVLHFIHKAREVGETPDLRGADLHAADLHDLDLCSVDL